MTLVVRQARLADVPAIQAFVHQAFGPLAPFKSEHRWRWQHETNLHRIGRPGEIPVWIALDGARVVGQIAVQPARVSIGRREHPAGWIVDVMILPAYRGQGLGHRLHDLVARHVPVLLMLTMAPATRRMAERGGALEIGEAWQFSRWAHLRSDDVRRYLGRRLQYRPAMRDVARLACDQLHLHRMLAPMANMAVSVRDRVAAIPSPGREIVEIGRFGADIDELWHAAAPRFGALTVRDSRYLNWRFVDCPDLRYRRFVARSDGRAVGYCVLRRTEQVELRLGVIADVFAMPDDTVTLAALIDHAIQHFGTDVASIDCVTSNATVARLLRARGFLRTRRTVATGTFADAGLRAQARSLAGTWFFTKGDHDWDQIQVA